MDLQAYEKLDPKVALKTADGGPHHVRENFTRVVTAPYLPNSLFGFIRTDNAFHGVEPVTDPDARRGLLLCNLYLVD